ncbi:MAG: glutamine--fructose-6-phosphate transaminase (isomerizing) [Chloroflexi bacterium]|jgi:glutamine---fructose-6-phosphate transaminase (isomerizing)|nr:glutamine--fructose-6-phosphate transaminase (isomerizing) [Chloroflexota bacterium]
MCGIVGYVGYREAQPILLESLQRLEYRGYDSCGIATLNDSLTMSKDVGRVVDFAKNSPKIHGKAGIGHTRWATHGTVTSANAHPHLDCTGNIAVVHNGVIENFQKLRDDLTKEGHRFNSDTDTEVIAHLIEKYYQGDLKEAVSKALTEVTGTYAVVVLAKGHKDLVVARQESPLVIGVGDKENFVASDVAASLDYTDRTIYLEDGDIGIVSPDSITITNNGQTVKREEQIVPWSVEDAQKAGYEHFMLKEIHEQPKAIENTLRAQIPFIKPLTILGAESEKRLEDIMLIACGTSYHAGLIGEYVIGKLCRVPTRVKIASEFDPNCIALEKTWVLGISQSGETTDTLRALKHANSRGCPTIGITNVQGSSITRITEQVIFTQSGPEIGVAATKTFIAQLTALYSLALKMAQLDVKAQESYQTEFKTLPSKVQQILDNEEQIAEYGRQLAKCDNAFFVGRGISYPVAMEGALKLKEISYIHAEAYAAGEIKHGPFALLRSNTPIIAIAPRDNTYDAMLTSIKEIKARGPQVIALAQEDDEEIQQFVDIVIRIPKVDPLFSPFLNTVAMQLLAYYAAKERGCAIDLPVNLAKSVTVP